MTALEFNCSPRTVIADASGKTTLLLSLSCLVCKLLRQQEGNCLELTMRSATMIRAEAEKLAKMILDSFDNDKHPALLVWTRNCHGLVILACLPDWLLCSVKSSLHTLEHTSACSNAVDVLY